MMSFGTGMLGASGWSTTPISMGQAMGQGMAGYADSRSRMLPGMLQGAQMARTVARDEEQDAARRNFVDAISPEDKVMRAFATLDPRGAAELKMKGPTKPWDPVVVEEGDDKVTYEINPQTLARTEIARAPRFQDRATDRKEVKRDVGDETWTVATEGAGDTLKESLISTSPKWQPKEGDTGQPNAKDLMGQANTLRDDYTAASATFRQTADAYQTLHAAAESAPQTMGTGDLAMITAFAKMLDPGGRVTDADYQNAAATGAYGQQIQAAIQKALSGQALLPEQREAYLTAADTIMNTRMSGAESLVSQYTDIAKRANIDPRDVVVDFQSSVQALMAKRPGPRRPPASQGPEDPFAGFTATER